MSELLSVSYRARIDFDIDDIRDMNGREIHLEARGSAIKDYSDGINGPESEVNICDGQYMLNDEEIDESELLDVIFEILEKAIEQFTSQSNLNFRWKSLEDVAEEVGMYDDLAIEVSEYISNQ